MHSTTKSFSHSSLLVKAESGTFETKAIFKGVKEKKTGSYQEMVGAGAAFRAGTGGVQGTAAVRGSAG